MTEQPGYVGAGRLVVVTVTNAVRTSAGPGPGTFRLPPAEAAGLAGSRQAFYGNQPNARGTAN